MTFKTRRVVTGLNEQGKGCVISDATLDQIPACRDARAVVWSTTAYPVDNSSNDEGAKPFSLEMFDHSSFMLMFQVEPGMAPAWHATNSIDYVTLLSGRVKLCLETGEVELAPGDILIDRGVIHSWEAIGDEPAVMLATVVRALPLGAGAQFDQAFDQFLPEKGGASSDPDK